MLTSAIIILSMIFHALTSPPTPTRSIRPISTVDSSLVPVAVCTTAQPTVAVVDVDLQNCTFRCMQLCCHLVAGNGIASDCDIEDAYEDLLMVTDDVCRSISRRSALLNPAACTSESDMHEDVLVGESDMELIRSTLSNRRQFTSSTAWPGPSGADTRVMAAALSLPTHMVSPAQAVADALPGAC